MGESIGIIGLGLLGTAIAERLNEAGHQVYGFDPKRSEGLPVVLCPDASEVFVKCSKVILSLPTSRVSAEVIDEVETSLRPGQVVLDTTTGAPDEMAALAERLKPFQVHYLEANVAGSSVLLRQGEAVIFVGGEETIANELNSLLVDLTSGAHYLGPVGTASRFKLVHNLILGLNRAALAEGLQFAEALGFEAQGALSVLQQTAAASVAMTAKGKRMATRDFNQPQARLSQHLKDVGLMLDEAGRTGAKVPLTTLHRTLLERAEELGFGEADNSAVLEAFNP
jgi:3-hydroxyisobutyrate dehydrogenase-like beta-hydroxyacid dehydrogenase